MFREIAAGPGGPIVAIQHNPLNPKIESDYPYMLTNRNEIMRDYAKAGVILSLSGHYHAGQLLNTDGCVNYFTAPALCDRPFSYAMVSLCGQEVSVRVHRLILDATPQVFDCHCHTELAYCSTTVTAAGAIERASMFGLAGICLTEHAAQLYCRAEDFSKARHIFEPETYRNGEHSRMAEFRKHIRPLQSNFVWVGLEVELDVDGRLTVHDTDRDWLDLIVAAIHWLPQELKGLSDAALSRAFMRTNERLLACGVDILAHPWRFFQRAGRTVPTDLYGDLADLLAATGTAAEINFHTNEPASAFFSACIERGVKIAFGSDSHAIEEAGSLSAHLALLRKAADRDDVSDLMFCPPARRL